VSARLYFDVHVPKAITRELRRRGVDVLTAQEDGSGQMPDPDLLDRAGALDRVHFSRDADLLREAARRLRSGVAFAGVIYAHQMKATIGQCVRDLDLLADCGDPDDFRGQIIYLPLR
jgi:hypothetical protein